MAWEPPHHWQEGLVDTMAAVLHDRDMRPADVAKRGGPGHRHMWSWGSISQHSGKYALPTTRSLVSWCQAVGIKPSDLFRRAGL